MPAVRADTGAVCAATQEAQEPAARCACGEANGKKETVELWVLSGWRVQRYASNDAGLRRGDSVPVFVVRTGWNAP
jgi:hypothetical protein